MDKVINESDVGVDRFHVGYAVTRGPDLVQGNYYSILNIDDFKAGNFEELMDMGAYN